MKKRTKTNDKIDELALEALLREVAEDAALAEVVRINRELVAA